MVIKQWAMVWILVIMSTGAQACEVTVSGAWLRLPPPISDTAAAYMTLSNHCEQTKILQSISSPQASMSMMHDMNMEMMTSVLLKPKQTFIFHPKSAHIMLMGLTSPIHLDKRVTMILHWQNGHQQTLQLKVKDMRGKGMLMMIGQ